MTCDGIKYNSTLVSDFPMLADMQICQFLIWEILRLSSVLWGENQECHQQWLLTWRQKVCGTFIKEFQGHAKWVVNCHVSGFYL